MQCLQNTSMSSTTKQARLVKRYRRQDEIGTPFCITYDFDTLEKDGCVTVRDRDTMEQERIRIEDLTDFINKKIEF